MAYFSFWFLCIFSETAGHFGHVSQIKEAAVVDSKFYVQSNDISLVVEEGEGHINPAFVEDNDTTVGNLTATRL